MARNASLPIHRRVESRRTRLDAYPKHVVPCTTKNTLNIPTVKTEQSKCAGTVQETDPKSHFLRRVVFSEPDLLNFERYYHLTRAKVYDNLHYPG